MQISKSLDTKHTSDRHEVPSVGFASDYRSAEGMLIVEESMIGSVPGALRDFLGKCRTEALKGQKSFSRGACNEHSVQYQTSNRLARWQALLDINTVQ